MKADNILQTIGNTPHVRINRLFGNTHTVYIKSERSNPGGSIKDRIALAMVEAAEKRAPCAPAAPSSSRPRATPAWAWPWWLRSRVTS
jgi:cysteine synthase A